MSGGAVLPGGIGRDVFVLDAAALTNCADIQGYNAGNTGSYDMAEGDVIDISALVGAAVQAGADPEDIVRIVRAPDGVTSVLQVDTDSVGGGADWASVATLGPLPNAAVVDLILTPGAGEADHVMLAPVAPGAFWSVAPSAPSVTEGTTSITFTVTRPESSAAQTVYVSTAAPFAATNVADFTTLVDVPVTFLAGALTADVTVNLSSDALPEMEETFALVVHDAPGAVEPLAATTFTIVDDDSVPTGNLPTNGDDEVAITPQFGSQTFGMGAGTDRVVVDFSTYEVDVHAFGVFPGGTYLLHSIMTVDASDRVNVYDAESFTFIGGAGDDSFDMLGRNSADMLFGGAGNDTIRGDLGNDVLDGGADDDLLIAGLGADVARGGAGADTIEVNDGGADAVDGGAGLDLLRMDRGTATEDFAFVFDAASDGTIWLRDGSAITGVELLDFTAGAGDDAITMVMRSAVEGAQVLRLGDGTDRVTLDFSELTEDIHAAAVTDTGDYVSHVIETTDGSHQVSVFAAEVFHIFGGAGNDDIDLTGRDGSHVLVGGAGADTIRGAGSNDLLDGGKDADALFAGMGADLLRGGAGADTLQGDEGNDTLDGGAGGDDINGGAGHDIARFSGSFFDYGLISTGAQSLQVTSNRPEDSGVDQVAEVEELHFSNGVFAAGLFTQNAIEDLGDLTFWTRYLDTFDINGQRTGRSMLYDDGQLEDSVYLNGVRTSVVVTDTADIRAWHTQEQTFDANGVRTGQTLNYDDGSILVMQYENGVPTTATRTDDLDANFWVSYTDTFDANGALAARTMLLDDGRMEDTTYVAGIRSTLLITDVEDDFGWTTQFHQYDDAGLRLSQTYTYDDGRLLQTQFTDGVLASADMEDAGDAYFWTDYSDTYDAASQLVGRFMTFDDGQTAQTTFVNGQRTELLRTDVNDVLGWSTVAIEYDVSGARIRQTDTFDDGLIIATDYTAGLRTSATVTDGGNTAFWLRYIDTFDAGGALVLRTMTYDDGRLAVSTFEGGIRSSLVITDVEDDFDFITIEEDFDAAGVIELQTQTYDNGRVLVTEYINGIRSEATVTDVNDLYIWTTYVDTFDAGGAIAQRYFTYDDGTDELIFF